MKVYFNNQEYDIQGEVTDLLSKIITNNPNILIGIEGDAGSISTDGITILGNGTSGDPVSLDPSILQSANSYASGVASTAQSSAEATAQGFANTAESNANTYTDAEVSGLVTGPGSAIDNRIVTFDATTGKLIKDGGQTIQDVLNSASGVSQSIANIAESNANDYTDLAVANFASSTSGLTDMAINNIASGETLVFNGTNFIPTAFPDGAGPATFGVSIRGSAVVGDNQLSIPIPFAGTLSTFVMKVGTSPTGATLIGDVKLNNTTSLWATTTANRPTITNPAVLATSGALDTNTVAQYDTLHFGFTQVGSTISGGIDTWFMFTLTPS